MDINEKSGASRPHEDVPLSTIPPTAATTTQPMPMDEHPKLNDTPTHCQCPVCHGNIVSDIKYKNGVLTWVACAGLAIFGCFCGCCLIPFCTKSLRDVEHHCPKCKYSIGTYTRLS